jgi:hypothetical protein
MSIRELNEAMRARVYSEMLIFDPTFEDDGEMVTIYSRGRIFAVMNSGDFHALRAKMPEHARRNESAS